MFDVVNVPELISAMTLKVTYATQQPQPCRLQFFSDPDKYAIVEFDSLSPKNIQTLLYLGKLLQV
jgi:hypothetical protein